MRDQDNILRAPRLAAQDPHAKEPLNVVLGEEGKPRTRLVAGAVIFLLVAAAGLAFWLISMPAMAHAPGFWGISVASVLFWLSVTQGMIAISCLLRVSHASWRYPLTRMLDIASLFGVWVAIIILPLLAKMRAMIYSPMGMGNDKNIIGTYGFGPNGHNMGLYGTEKLWRTPMANSMWGSHAWWIDYVFVVTAYLAGFYLLRLTVLPDFAVLRDTTSSKRRTGFARWARSWFGTGDWIGAAYQWRRLRLAEGFLVVGTIMAFFASQTVLGWDFQLAAGGNWDSSIFPFQVNLASLMAGTAMLVLVMTAVRATMRGGEIIGDKQYDSIGKLFIALGLLFFYFRWCDYITAWYGHAPDEWKTQIGRTVENPIALTILVVGCMAVPIFANIFGGIRKSPFWMCLISILALVGVWCQKYLDTVPAFRYNGAVAMQGGAAFAGALVWIGCGGLFLLTYFWAVPRFSAMSWWGLAKWRSRSSVRPLGNASVTVMVEDAPVWEN